MAHLDPQLLQYKEKITTEAERLVLEDFPTTMTELNTLLGSPLFKKQSLTAIHPSNPSKRMRCEGVNHHWMPCNKYILNVIDSIKPHIQKLMEDARLIKLWITLVTPKVEDGNNFGVLIQQQVAARVDGLNSIHRAFFASIADYFERRPKLKEDACRYPGIEDFQRAIYEVDDWANFTCWLVLKEIKNEYCILYDVVVKNLDKIKRPKSRHAIDILY